MMEQHTASGDFSTPLWETEVLRRQFTQLDAKHTDFMMHWRQSLTTLIPAQVQLEAGALEFKTYSQFIADVASPSDIQVFEVEALQSLCAWSLDLRLFPTAVDCMFGGAGRIPVRDLSRRYTPIELGVRRRCLESLATAYEAAWQNSFPIRLHPLRQEQQPASLRMASPQDTVLHARFHLKLNAMALSIDLCMPRRAIEILTAEVPQENATPDASVKHAWGHSLQHNVYAAPVEAVAILGKTQMTVAQLLSLSIGQVIPIELSEPVDLMVDGVTLMKGRYGVRSGQYALKVEDILQNQLPPPAPSAPDVSASGSESLSEIASALSDFSQQVAQDEARP
jgi:flagellar motor switch protein FliM